MTGARVNFVELLNILAPEVLLTVAVFVLLGVDLLALRAKPPEERRTKLGALSAIVLAAAALLACRHFQANASFLNDMLVADPLTTTVKVALLLFALITSLISMGHDVSVHTGEYFAMLLFGTMGMLFMVQSEELVMIYVGLELTSISLYILAAFNKHLRRSAEASMKYFLFGALSSAFLYFGLTFLYGLAGGTSLAAAGALLAAGVKANPLALTALLFTIVGFGFKIALVPFHFWAPDAYEGAPTPITAFLSTASKVASFYVFIKVLLLGFLPAAGSASTAIFTGGWAPLLAILAVVSMTFGNLVAMQQRNLKRLLAYSSIAHGGYILVGLVAASSLGHAAVLYYLLTYGFTNLGAFGVIAAVSQATGADDLEDFSGVSRRAPYLALLMIIFALSLAGVPPLAGFFSKFYVFAAAIERDTVQYGLLWLVLAGVANSAVSLYYYLRILKQMYIVEGGEGSPIRAHPATVAGLTACMVLVVGLGAYPAPILALIESLIPLLPVP